MADIFDSLDLTNSIRDYDFTKKAIRGIHKTVDSDRFDDMDAESIRLFLIQELELISFKDQLKRYIWSHAGYTRPFNEVPDSDYSAIIRESFRENNAPFSFEPTTRKPSAIIKSWLSQDSVRREVVFLLGFGLRMTTDDVSGFLKKVLSGEDFNFQNVNETICWHCFKNRLPFAKARELSDYYRGIDAAGGADAGLPEEFLTEAFPVNQYFDLSKEADLKAYLVHLKKSKAENKHSASFEQFGSLLDRAKGIIAGMFNADRERADVPLSAEDISASDIESVIFNGIPVTDSGNLKKLSLSTLAKHFPRQRLSRQRIDNILKKKQPVERTDLITLVFFIDSQVYLNEIPDERCRIFIGHANEVLVKSGMEKLYPVNPFEAFVMLCMLTDTPLATFSEVWEMSYEGNEG